jgi:hypothetical protein
MHLFEFQDHPHIPSFLRSTLLDVLEFCNGPVRDYYGEVCAAIVAEAKIRGSRQVVELGAGSAPLTQRLAREPAAQQLTCVACDLFPDVENYRELEARDPGRVRAMTEPVDFTQPRVWEPDTLLVLCATFHHIPPELRRQTLAAITQSAQGVMIFEPIQNNPLSMLFVLTSIFSAIASPLWWRRPGVLRRVLWCWVVPVVPLMFVWDGLVSCVRQWKPQRWRDELAHLLPPDRVPSINTSVHTAIVGW